jgi:hypothetical protein
MGMAANVAATSNSEGERMDRALVVLGVASTLLLPGAARAMPSGISGYSGLVPDKTCVMCHPGGNPPTASIEGPATLAPGATGEYTFRLKTDRTFGGLDVAVDNAAAKLAPKSPMTQLLGGEITHTQPLRVTNGEIIVTLEMTAPSSPGVVTLHADGQADKMPQIADSSAAAIDFAVTVGSGSAGGVGGNGAGAGGGAGTAMEPPAHGCAFAGSAPALDSSPASVWLALLVGLAFVLRWRRD